MTLFHGNVECLYKWAFLVSWNRVHELIELQIKYWEQKRTNRIKYSIIQSLYFALPFSIIFQAIEDLKGFLSLSVSFASFIFSASSISIAVCAFVTVLFLK